MHIFHDSEFSSQGTYMYKIVLLLFRTVCGYFYCDASLLLTTNYSEI